MKKCLALLLLICLAPAQAQMQFLELGTDAAGDDGETLDTAAGGFSGAAIATSVDDIISGSVRTVDQTLEFQMQIGADPSNEPLIANQYCWMAAFEVIGQEEEYVALVCRSYNPVNGGNVEEDTNRGTEVASEFEIDGTTVTITVPFENINAAEGDVLKDIYMLTYSGGLYVSDTMPDAKSDRNAAQNLGAYVIGAEALGLPEVPTGELLEPQFADMDATSVELEFSYEALSTQSWTYNWTNENPTGNFSFGGNVSQGSVHFLVTDHLGDLMLDAKLEAPLDLNQSFDGFEGNWSVQVLFKDFLGDAYLNVDADFEPGIQYNPNTPGLPIVQGEEEFTDGNSGGENKESPAPLLLTVMGLVGLAFRRK